MNVNHPPLGKQPSNQTIECFVCGYGMVYNGRRFCSDRCREAFDAGFSRLDPNQARAFLALPLDGWHIMAGPPSTTTGAAYYDGFLAAAEAARQHRKVRNRPQPISSISVENRLTKSRRWRSAFAGGRSAPGGAP